ncbi:NlpC/P60 family protein [Embleya sp. NBC_00888]|uniref:C40 family peptidase n=1 Tax=Embleya sp. NBC_00888 TaxID=2975960 RepID=UPI003869CEC6|nr:NlpC/P60 family protein [Embleya sp. NBC_00888]
MPRSFIHAAVPAGLAAVLVLTITPGAFADDPAGSGHPGTDQVRRAQDAVTGKVSDVGLIEAELDREASDLERLDIRAGVAVEAYNGAVVLREQTRDRAVVADGHLRAADAQLGLARDELGRLAAQTYRMGGGARLGTFQAVLGADSPADLVTRTESLRRISQDGDDTVRRGTTAVRDAATAKADAVHTAEAAARATEAVRAAKDRVEAELAAQQRRVGEIAARRTALLSELAELKQTSVALETQRRDDLAAEAQRRAEEEARARAEAEAAREQARQEADRQAEAAREAREAREQAASKAGSTSEPAKPAKGTDPAAATRPDTSGKAPAAAGVSAAIAYAKAQLGKPYVWGGEGPRGYDCSGLVMRAWREAGVNMTHFAATQYVESTPVSYRNLRPGDLIFWSGTKNASDIHHVAMYLGGGRMIHAPRTGDVVKISNMFYMGTPDYYARPS